MLAVPSYPSILPRKGVTLYGDNKASDATQGQQDWQAIPLIAGIIGAAPERGCSEIHLDHAHGKRFLATVEPWHGTEVVVSTESEPASLMFGPRMVIDDTLAEGRALWAQRHRRRWQATDRRGQHQQSGRSDGCLDGDPPVVGKTALLNSISSRLLTAPLRGLNPGLKVAGSPRGEKRDWNNRNSRSDLAATKWQ